VSSYRVEQRRLEHRGREFHFVSYQARPHNARRGEDAHPDMWFLINDGKRYPVMAQVPGQLDEEIEQALRAWVDDFIHAEG
jgi:hypothetical protein